MLLTTKQISTLYGYSEANARSLLSRPELAKYFVTKGQVCSRGRSRFLYELNEKSLPAFDYVFGLKGYKRVKSLEEISDV